FVWDAREAKWEEGFAHLEQYVTAHGDTRALRSDTTGGYPLGPWVNTQRSSHKRSTLAAARVARLDALGFVWEIRQRRGEPSR
ncbi:MAG: hypothetical protein EXR63_00895, partial [Dehalococcoidia bacterium]|nr:hypothetical protein [Dehalococcoidia bacterium]